MSVYKAIKDQQKLWAVRRGIKLVGSKGTHGEPAYTPCLELNLFTPLSTDSRSEIEAGDGDELKEDGGPCKMQAVHSSAALHCNLVEYWRQHNRLQVLLSTLGVDDIKARELRYEQHRPVVDEPDRTVFPQDPNLDSVLSCDSANGATEVAIESKFTESYNPRRNKPVLSRAYLRLKEIWSDIPNCRSLAESLARLSHSFEFLDAAQLVKHILGLKHANGRSNFTLIYLTYIIEADECNKHAQEAEVFSDIVRKDGIDFRTLTYQDVFRSLRSLPEEHKDYVRYLCERYAVSA